MFCNFASLELIVYLKAKKKLYLIKKQIYDKLFRNN